MEKKIADLIKMCDDNGLTKADCEWKLEMQKVNGKITDAQFKEGLKLIKKLW